MVYFVVIILLLSNDRFVRENPDRSSACIEVCIQVSLLETNQTRGLNCVDELY